MIILVDMDEVLFDWETGFSQRIVETDPTIELIKPEDRVGYFVQEQYPPEHRETLARAMRSPNMYTDLLPIEGAQEALAEMMEEHDVFVCSTPQVDHPTCASDKYDAMAKHFGEHMRKRTILTHDKTLVHGDFLFDDKVTITGARKPAWQHIIFDNPANRLVSPELPRIFGWLDWRDALKRASIHRYWAGSEGIPQ